MKIFIDTANLDEIREVNDWGILAGVTTNPSLIAKEGRNFIEAIHEICEIVQGPVSAEVVAQDTPGMLKEARLLRRISPHVVIKVPMSPAGLAATRVLSDEGTRVNVTLCFQASQALFAGIAGATYISPFIGRIDDVSWNGTDLIRQIVEIYGQSPDISTQVLSASIRHPVHLVESALAGAHVATCPYAVIKKAVKHPLTDIGNDRFLADWQTVPERDIVALMEQWLADRD